MHIWGTPNRRYLDLRDCSRHKPSYEHGQMSKAAICQIMCLRCTIDRAFEITLLPITVNEIF